MTSPPNAASTDSAAESAARRARLLEESFAQYQGELLGTLYYLVGNLEDARDALQEAFIKCWRNQDQLDAVQNLKAWIFRVALNTGRDIRETAWRRKRQGLPTDESALPAQAPAPDEIIEHDERLARLRQALSELRPEEREIFLLRQNGDLTYEEIGHTLGLPSGTVKTRMRLALARLRAALGEG